jgi:hypothetical protein
MTDAVQIAIIASIGPTLIGLVNAISQIRTSRRINGIGENVQKVETATNHMHDALVASTKLASHAEGVNDEKIRVAIKENIPIDTVVSGKQGIV